MAFKHVVWIFDLIKMELRIVSRSGKEMVTLTLTEKSTLNDLKQKFHEKCKIYLVRQYSPDRQRFCLKSATGPAINDNSVPLISLLKDERVVCFKDLGLQLSWRLVYIIEYAGPLIIAPLLYIFPEKIYGYYSPKTWTQK